MELDSLKYYTEPPAEPIAPSPPLLDEFLDPDQSSLRGHNLRLVLFAAGALMAFFGICYMIRIAVPELRAAFSHRESPTPLSLSELAGRGPKAKNHVCLHSFAVPRCAIPCCPSAIPVFLPLVAPGREKTNDAREIRAVLLTPDSWSREDVNRFVAGEKTVDGVVCGRRNLPTGDVWALIIGDIPDLHTAACHAAVCLGMGTLGLTLMLLSYAGASLSLRESQLVYVAMMMGCAIRRLEALLTPAGLAALTLAAGTVMFWIGTEIYCEKLYDTSDNSYWALYATPLVTGGAALLLFGLVRTVLSLRSASPRTENGCRGTSAETSLSREGWTADNQSCPSEAGFNGR